MAPLLPTLTSTLATQAQLAPLIERATEFARLNPAIAAILPDTKQAAKPAPFSPTWLSSLPSWKLFNA
jgi:hypothetical protein